MFRTVAKFGSMSLLAGGLALAACTTAPTAGMQQQAAADGIVRVRSAYPMAETIDRIKQDVAAKGIMMFDEIDQAQLAADDGIEIRPSTLLVFGNPPLGTQFMTANQSAGLDWPVRLQVFEDANGEVWAAFTDFEFIKDRHGITTLDPQFQMASDVIASITSTVRAQ